jgi:hypothetical protein
MPIQDAPQSQIDEARRAQAHQQHAIEARQRGVRAVKCKTCGADPGHYCIGSNLLSRDSHAARVNLWRSEQEWDYSVVEEWQPVQERF